MTQAESLLARLVAFDTTSRLPNRACIDFIRDTLDGQGIKSEIVAAPAQAGEGGESGKACLWVTIGPEDRPGIVLAGHTDTVPVDGQNWTSDPFRLAERDNRLYARGACDMKGFIACALAAVSGIDRGALKRPLHLAFTHDEETDMSGAVRLTGHLRARGIKPEWVWIGEPTSLRIVDAHKGTAVYATNIAGVSYHSSQPDKGLNAIECAAQFIDIVRRVAEAKKRKPWPGSRFTPPYSTFNIGTIKGGTAENIVAGHCEIMWQARSHPGDDMGAAMAEIERLTAAEIGPRLEAFPGRAKIGTCTCFDIPPLEATKNNPGQETLARLTGHNRPDAVSFATEAGFFQKLGTHAVICGPGRIEDAHQPDEYVERAQLAACVDLIGRVAARAAQDRP